MRKFKFYTHPIDKRIRVKYRWYGIWLWLKEDHWYPWEKRGHIYFSDMEEAKKSVAERELIRAQHSGWREINDDSESRCVCGASKAKNK